MRRILFTRVLGATILTATALLPITASEGAQTHRYVAPAVGQCYDFTIADVSLSTPTKTPVPCSSMHTAEVWRVRTWPSGSSPYALSEARQRSIARSVCNMNTFPHSRFNYWAWYVPSKSQWNKGLRWLRCDAMRATGIVSNAPTGLRRWHGRRLP